MERRPEQLLWMREILGHVFHMVRRWLCGNTDDLLPRHVRAVQLAVWKQLVWIPLRVHVCDERADFLSDICAGDFRAHVGSEPRVHIADRIAGDDRADRITHDARSSNVQVWRDPRQDNNVQLRRRDLVDARCARRPPDLQRVVFQQQRLRVHVLPGAGLSSELQDGPRDVQAYLAHVSVRVC